MAAFLFVMLSLIGAWPRVAPAANVPTHTPPAACSEGDDSKKIVCLFGNPDFKDTTAYDNPRPPLPTLFLEYRKERVRFSFIPGYGAKIGDPPPYRWKLLGFQDPRTDAVLTPQEVLKRIEKRRKRPGELPEAIVGDKSGSKPTPDTAVPNAPQARDAACKSDLHCWGEKHFVDASVKCVRPIERLAKYSSKWTDGWLTPKFSHYRWKDSKKGIITYIGDKIQFQNGFGAWQDHTYGCDFDPATGSVRGVRAVPGRLE